MNEQDQQDRGESTPWDHLSPLQQRVWRIAGYVGRGGLPRGPRAQLRRLGADDRQLPPQVFWDIVARFDIGRGAEEEYWLQVLPLMVRHPHDPHTPPGVALARAGISGARIERWLRLDRHRARREARRLLSKLGDSGLDWSGGPRGIGLGPLLHDWTESQKRAFARQYFLSPEFIQSQSQGVES